MCHHPNIVKLIGISSIRQEEVYIVTEYCEDGNALEYLKLFRLNNNCDEYFRAVIKISMGVCDAMHYLHSHGYTHRDISISNIMVLFPSSFPFPSSLLYFNNFNFNF